MPHIDSSVDHTLLEGGSEDLTEGDFMPKDLARADLQPEDASATDLPTTLDCVATLCMTGAFTYDDGGNPFFGLLCELLPGIINDCSSGACHSRYPMLGSDGALEALFSRLDDNGDGRYDQADPACEVRLLGYSWGGVNAAAIAERFLADPRLGPARRVVHKLIVIDPYIPFAQVRAVEGVKSFWEYRHTVAPFDDCSEDTFGGPYFGLVPTCHRSVRCTDYDYSLAPDEFFNGYYGDGVGHCTIVWAATPSIAHNLNTGTDDPDAPPSVPVVTF
ncbi:MAG: hypothetical protein JRH20_30555 [Deltaproteobacteria bacterium]|nr:hypothetical protein [Deltaproteobacteria bacterium]